MTLIAMEHIKMGSWVFLIFIILVAGAEAVFKGRGVGSAIGVSVALGISGIYAFRAIQLLEEGNRVGLRGLENQAGTMLGMTLAGIFLACVAATLVDMTSRMAAFMITLAIANVGVNFNIGFANLPLEGIKAEERVIEEERIFIRAEGLEASSREVMRLREE